MSGIERDRRETKQKIDEIRARPDTLGDGPGGLNKAYRESGKIEALRWVLGDEEVDR